MKFTKGNVVRVINEYFLQADLEPCGDLIAEIYELEGKTEKVVVPKFVAEWIERNKESEVSLQIMLKCYQNYYYNMNRKCQTDEEKAVQWYVDNPYKFIQAYEDGYEVEKEPLYCININGQYLVKMIPERNVHKFVEEVNLRIWDPQAYQLTEQEIKAIDERYIPFMVPVDEVNND